MINQDASKALKELKFCVRVEGTVEDDIIVGNLVFLVELCQCDGQCSNNGDNS